MAEQRGIAMTILGIVAIIAIVGLVLLFTNTDVTGELAARPAGQCDQPDLERVCEHAPEYGKGCLKCSCQSATNFQENSPPSIHCPRTY